MNYVRLFLHKTIIDAHIMPLMRNCCHYCDTLDAISHNDLYLFKYMISASNIPLTWYKCSVAAITTGGIDILIWLYNNKHLCNIMDGIPIAAQNGHFEVVKFLCAINYKSGKECLYCALLAAIKNNHRSVVNWLMLNCCCGNGNKKVCSYHLLHNAAARGDIEQVIKFHKCGDCDEHGVHVINLAAIHGHLEVVKWLYYNCRAGYCTLDATNWAAIYGHHTVVKWLSENVCHLSCDVEFSNWNESSVYD